MNSNRRRNLLIGLGLLLFLLAAFLPTEWYDRIPRGRENLPEPPVKGVTLLRLCFALEGACLLGLGLLGVPQLSVRPEDCLWLPDPEGGPGEDLRHPVLWVALATAVAAALRLYNLSSDLGIDEITTVLDYRDQSVFHVIAAYVSSNNHLLNTLMVKGLVSAAGMEEWAIRLPAVLLGVACVPALYYLGRIALGRQGAVLAAFLLAVSYHHISFSQNARGYTGHLLWSSLGTAFFLKGITTGKARYWVLYVVSMFLAIATILYAVFVVAGHGLAFLGVCWLLRRQGKPVLPLAKAAGVAWVVLGGLCFHLYASSLPQVYVYMVTVYRTAGDGYSLLSLEYAEELRRGLAAGLGNGATLGAIAALAVMGAGFLAFFRRHPFYCLTLISPLVATVLFVQALNLIILPRSLLWGLPIACLFAAAAVTTLGRWLWANRGAAWERSRRLTPVALAAPLVLLSLWSLPAYYRTPKQSNRQSLQWVLEHKQPDDLLIPIFVAEWGPRFYGPRSGLRENESFFPVRSLEHLERMEQQNPGKTIWLMTTLSRGLRKEYPDLNRHIAERYQLRQTFPATLGDGEISIWCGPSAPADGVASK